jgi:2-haloacid dehalogenase
MARVCVFDVNETLLDLTALDEHFSRVFGDAGVRQIWFAQLIQSALVATVTDAYADFGTIGGAALDMITARREIRLSSSLSERNPLPFGQSVLHSHV